MHATPTQITRVNGSEVPDAAPFLAACRRRPVVHVPVWFMRQAGRSLPEYRSARGAGSILTAIADPALAAELTLQPVRRYGVDAAILFSDIVVPVHAIGFGIDIHPGKGPIVADPIRTAKDVTRLRPLESDTDVPYVIEAIRILTDELSSTGTPLIGFAGAPFTVASYLVEGGPTRTFARVKSFMHATPRTWHHLMDLLADMAAAFLRAQVEAGASALQVFDSWAGSLSPGEYTEFVAPATERVLSQLVDLDVPKIVFGVGTGELLDLMARCGPDVVGVDWRVPIDVARNRVGPDIAVQGNLDPALCLAPWEIVAGAARSILSEAGTAPGFIFNLGHGVLPETDPAILTQLVELVHAEGRAGVIP